MVETGVQKPSQPPKSYAASVKVLIDAVQTTFGLAVLLMVFFGLSLVALAFGGFSNLSETRANLMWILIGLMAVNVVGVVALRLWRPDALGGPPLPQTEDVTIRDSRMS